MCHLSQEKIKKDKSVRKASPVDCLEVLGIRVKMLSVELHRHWLVGVFYSRLS